MYDTAILVEERYGQTWLSGVGPNAKFANYSDGWFITLASYPSSIFVGNDEPKIKAGDQIRITLESLHHHETDNHRNER
jgi:hypothetical protein